MIAAAYCCAVIAGSLIGVVTVLGPEMAASIGSGDGQLSLLRLPFVVAFVAAEFFPLIFVAALPFTAMATLLLLRSRQAGWLPFTLLGALCPATVVLILFLLGPGYNWDFSVSPARQVPYSLWSLLMACLTFVPAGAVAGLVYWKVGFARWLPHEAYS